MSNRKMLLVKDENLLINAKHLHNDKELTPEQVEAQNKKQNLTVAQ